ncbi:Flavonoid-6-hydroxylase [Castilleja foliolosa]|uniref:Flavonoid-6-hydroxylase n=1 Tax=Castilleja foliolosa TaxID=1961234 RepID=A0ABD3DC41_9LAMI
MESISFSILGAIIAFFFLVYYQYWSKYNPKTSSTSTYIAPPAEAGGARLFTGHLHLMAGGSAFTELPHFKLAALADKYGPIFTIRLGVKRALVVSSWELAKELYTTHDLTISSRPKLRAAKHLSYDFVMFGFAPYSKYYSRMRKLISVELLSNSRVEMQRNVRVSETSDSINDLYKLWEENKKKVVVDMKKWLGDLNLNVVVRVVAGKRFCGGDEDETRRCKEVFRDFFHLAGKFVPADALPYLRWLDIGGHEKKMKETAKELDIIVDRWLAEHRKENERSGEDKKPRDFMDVMLSLADRAQLDSEYDSDTIIKATCQTLISGGTDTTTVMLVWAVSLLLNNRHVLKKAQQELDKHVGKERRVNESDIENLVYLKAITKEILRLYPAGPLGGIREFSENCNVGGYNVQKGTWLIVNMWRLHRDPTVWGDDSLEFNPERFLSKHGDLDVRGQHFELIPFGAGRRICPGVNFGMQMMHLVLANLLHAFDLSTVSDETVDMTESAGMTNMKATPLDVLVSPRLSAKLYG